MSAIYVASATPVAFPLDDDAHNLGMRRSLAWALAVLVASCQPTPAATGPEPTGAIAAVAQNAIAFQKPGVELSDRLFEDFLAGGDFKKTYGDRADELSAQLRKTRDAVAAARKASARSHGSRLASPYFPAGEFSTTLFGQTFATVLDAMTKSSGTRESKPNPYTSTESGPTMTTTTTLNVSDVFSSSGSRVTYTLHWTYRSIAKENTSGATLHDSSDDRTIVGVIDVCPDASGSVNGSLDSRAQLSSTKDGTRGATTSSAFAGTVDDSAFLRTVRQTFRDETKWQSASGDGGYDANMSTTYAAAQSGSFLGGMQSGGFTGSFTSTGNGAESVSKASAWSLVLDAYALDSPYQEAQKLWRNGRCVMVLAPDYKAETPIDVAAQERVQHDEEVDTGSETKFTVDLKHRFGGGRLTQAVTAGLSGDKSLEPGRLEAAPGSLTYKAPDEEDKRATATLRTTSKRGIGTLVLDFHTAGAQLQLEMNGTLRMSFGPLTYVWTVAFERARFQRKDGATSSAVVPYTLSASIEGITIPCAFSTTGSGKVTLLATKEKRGDASVWVVRADPLGSAETLVSNTCVGAPPPQTYGAGEGGYGQHFVETAREIVIPLGGGTTTLRGSDPRLFLTLEGTATGTVVKS